ncbi:unnamed protein product [Linum trigynum]|uniref:Uncharacterized protein n=1 Tax=Linum trigynum TaxID=586398 RepID=A0AAV2EEG5_9ROSI
MAATASSNLLYCHPPLHLPPSSIQPPTPKGGHLFVSLHLQSHLPAQPPSPYPLHCYARRRRGDSATAGFFAVEEGAGRSPRLRRKEGEKSKTRK